MTKETGSATAIDWPVFEDEPSTAETPTRYWDTGSTRVFLRWPTRRQTRAGEIRFRIGSEVVVVRGTSEPVGVPVLSYEPPQTSGWLTMFGNLSLLTASVATDSPAVRLMNAIPHASNALLQQCLEMLAGVVQETSTRPLADLTIGDERLSADADQVIPVLGDDVTAADHDLMALATSYRREDVALRAPFDDD